MLKTIILVPAFVLGITFAPGLDLSRANQSQRHQDKYRINFYAKRKPDDPRAQNELKFHPSLSAGKF